MKILLMKIGLEKNSNLSYESNFYDENTIKKNKCDLISEIEMFI